jgi:hypothetical protein
VKTKAEICWEAAWALDRAAERFICHALSLIVYGRSLRHTADVIKHDLQRHLGETWGGSPSRKLPSPWADDGRPAYDARVELLSLAAEYYEAEAEGRVRR